MVYTVDMIYTVDMVNTVDMFDAVDNVDTVDTVDTFDGVYTFQTALHCFNSSWAGRTDVAERWIMWFTAEVSESHFFILETRMRVSLIQSRTSRRD